MRHLPFCLTVLAVVASPLLLRSEDAAWLRAQPESVAWWEAARFGVFICWGPVSIRGTEIGWSRRGPRPGHRSGAAAAGIAVEEYDALYHEFNPTAFDADAWIDTVKASGARYIIFLTKHHDGFCLFHTRHTEYSIAHTPFQRDVTAELARACHRADIRIFWYYSQPDWHHPDYRTDNHARYIDYLHAQITELCSNYGPIAGIWFDGLGGTSADWDSKTLFRRIRTLQPGALINNRAGLPGDFDTPEQHIGNFRLDRPWESCITLQASGWSWRPDQALKTLPECLHLLVRCAGGGGNLALDIGPMPDGRIHPDQAARLRQMGTWLQRYGDAVYGTEGGPYQPSQWWGASTRRDRRIFLHVLTPGSAEWTFPALPRHVLAARVLTGGAVAWEQTPEALRLRLDAAAIDPVDTIIELTLDGSAMDIAPIAVPEPGCVSAGRPARASAVWSLEYDAAKAFDTDPGTRWGAAPQSTSGWIEVDLERPCLVDRIAILEAPWNRVRCFSIRVLTPEGAWQTVHEGATLGDAHLRIQPVTATAVRLDIAEASDVPTIWEIQVFGEPQR
ncbi:MAG: alpha-L-fucosidase [Lentisphaeria bacterium]|nr:alpha-L-fucosidase [Lentisphaeria bacterium]